MSEILFVETFIFFLGACIGSFLNVCIVRLPKEESVVKPSSHCVACKKPIAWFDNIPLVSYIALGGKCRYCKAKFSVRYFFVELLTAFTFFAFYKFFGLTWMTLAYWVMVSGFIVATFVDFEHRIIPDEVSVGGMCVGLILSFLIPQLQGLTVEQGNWLINFKSLAFSVIGVLVGGGSIYLMGLAGDLIFKKESMGGGDVKLMAMIGAFMGWKLALLTFFLAPFFGAFYGIAEKIRTKDSAIAYGPFIVLAALTSLFYGQKIINWILSGYGLR